LAARRRKQKMGISLGHAPAKRAKLLSSLNLFGVLKFLLFICSLAAVLVGFAFLDGYVKEQTLIRPNRLTIELAGDTPGWVSEKLRNRVFAAATAEIGNTQVDQNATVLIQRSIKRLVPWLQDVRVQATHNSILIEGHWRKPIALVKAGRDTFYIDGELVVLDYMPISDLPVVIVDGLGAIEQRPGLGQKWHSDDLAAALGVLSRLERMDAVVSPDKPLMREIDRINVSNFNGRKNKRQPHIVLYTKGKTQIIWGAEIGTWQRHLESPDDDKLAKLYTYYQQYGTLSGVKYINLRDPQQTIYLPVDKY